MFGSNHAVTDFPEMLSCPICKELLGKLDREGQVELDYEGRVVPVATFDANGQREPKYASFKLIKHEGKG